MNKERSGFLVIVIGTILDLSSGTEPGYAQQATDQPDVTPSASAPAAEANGRPIVRPRDLMSDDEREDYRTALREASTPEARHEIREEVLALLRQRASDEGVVLAEPDSRDIKLGTHQNGEHRHDMPLPPRGP